jgi:hypothetical protein
VVSYTRGTEWSPPEQVADSIGVPKGIAADAAGRVYVLFQTTAGRLYSVYRTVRPGVQEQGPSLAAGSRVATIVRGVLFLPISSFTLHSSLFSLSGQKVMALKPGANDVRALSPGVYFVRKTSGVKREASGVTKVVLSR